MVQVSSNRKEILLKHEQRGAGRETECRERLGFFSN